jgi:hypothetical protein
MEYEARSKTGDSYTEITETVRQLVGALYRECVAHGYAVCDITTCGYLQADREALTAGTALLKKLEGR